MTNQKTLYKQIYFIILFPCSCTMFNKLPTHTMYKVHNIVNCKFYSLGQVTPPLTNTTITS